MTSKSSEDSLNYPTVLVAEDDNELLSALVDTLRQDGYLVLEAHDGASAMDIVRTHSRPIHLTLISTNMNKGVLAAALKQYRPEMNVLLVARNQHGQLPNVSTPEIVLAKVRAFFKRPK